MTPSIFTGPAALNWRRLCAIAVVSALPLSPAAAETAAEKATAAAIAAEEAAEAATDAADAARDAAETAEEAAQAAVDAAAEANRAAEAAAAEASPAPPATSADGEPVFTEAFMASQANFDAGRDIWRDQCRHCHGKSAYPGKAPKLKPKRYTADFVYRRITKGFRKMPPWEDVYNQEERMQIVAFIMNRKFSP